MTDEIRALIAAARPGSRVTVVIVEVPGAMHDSDPKLWSAVGEAAPTGEHPGGRARLADVLATRQKPFTVPELAEYLSAEPGTIQAWCRKRRFHGAMKFGRLGWRIPPSAVVAFLAENDDDAAPADLASEGRLANVPPSTSVHQTHQDASAVPRCLSEFDVKELSQWRAARADSTACSPNEATPPSPADRGR